MNCNKLKCYLSEDALMAFEEFKRLGMDEELAFTMVESLGGESVYCLDELVNGLDDAETVEGSINERANA